MLLYFLFISELVERVFLKIVTADTDDKLQSSLNIFLPPVLLKLGSSNEKVKSKVSVYLDALFYPCFLLKFSPKMFTKQ